MGNAVAQNIINDSINSMVSVSTNVASSCLTNVDETQNITICNNNSETFLFGIDMSEVVEIDQACFSDATVTTNISQQIQVSATQAAEAIVKDLGLGSSDASNLTNLYQQLTTVVQNNFLSTCVSNVQLNQSLNICDNKKLVAVGFLDYDGAVEGFSTCTQKVTANNSVAISIVDTISQKAVAKVLDDIFKYVLILLIIVAVFALLFFGAPALLIFVNWKLIAVLAVFVFLLILLYLGLAYWRKWFPF